MYYYFLSAYKIYISLVINQGASINLNRQNERLCSLINGGKLSETETIVSN